LKIRYLPRIGSTCNFLIAFSANFQNLVECDRIELLAATPLNNGYQVTAGNGEHTPNL